MSGMTEYKRAYEHFSCICNHAPEEQESLLYRILSDNSQTEFGVAHSFEFIKKLNEYKSRVPISEYSDYDESICRIIEGASDVLFSGRPVFYNLSSGSTGTPKFIPLTSEDINKQKLYEEVYLRGCISEYVDHDSEDELFGCIFNINDIFTTRMEDGTPYGVRSNAYWWNKEANEGFDCNSYSSPREVQFPEKFEDLLYVKLRFALSRRDLTAIHAVFVHRLVGLLKYLENNFDSFIHDIRTGEVSECFKISEYWAGYIKERLEPDEKLADILDLLDRKNLREGFLLKLWPKLKYVRVIGGNNYYLYMDMLNQFANGVSICSFAYASSESEIGIALAKDRLYEYALIPDICFYEFIPEEKMYSSEETLSISDLQTGNRYEMIITTLSGLYRYRIGDIIEVTGWFGKTPVIKLCYRKDMVLSITDEMMNAEQFESAMISFMKSSGIKASGYSVAGCYDEAPRYKVYIETETELTDDSENHLDEELQKVNLGYKSAREMNDIGKVSISRLAQGAYKRFERKGWKGGKRLEQSKPIRILSNVEQIEFFDNECL